MKYSIAIIFFLIHIISFSQDDLYTQGLDSMDEYYRNVDWKFYPDSVVQLNDSIYSLKAIPYDYNDPGAIDRVVGNYIIDFVGHTYLIIGSSDRTLTVYDKSKTGQGPQSLQKAKCYRSVYFGDGVEVGSVDYSVLDLSERWKRNGADNELLWRKIISWKDSIQFTLDHDTIQWQEGKIYYDSTKHAITYFTDIEGVALNLAFETCVRVYNNSSDTVFNGTVVAPKGEQTGSPDIVLADSRYKETSTLVAVATHDIMPYTYGIATFRGEVGGLNTLAYAGYKFLYLNGSGQITTTRPSGGHFETILGSPGRIDAVNGSIVVDIRTSSTTVEQNKYTGWPDADDNSFPDNVGITIDDATRTIYLSATPESEYYYYQEGQKYISSGDTFTFSNIEGDHLIFFDTDSMTEIVGPTDEESRHVLEKHPGAMHIYWSTFHNTYIFVNNEFHTFDMNGKTKGALHDIHACTIIEPILLTDFSVDGSGNLAANAQFGNTSGKIRNEDIKTVIPSKASTVGYSIFYKNGVSDWRRSIIPGFSVVNTGTGRIAYNLYSGGVWSLAEATNGDYVYYLILVSNTLGEKMGTVVGQGSYPDAESAMNAGLGDAATILRNLPIKEIANVGLVVYQTRDNYTNAVKGRIVSLTDPITSETVDYIDLSIKGYGGTAGSTGMQTLTDDPNGQSSYAGYGGSLITVNSAETGWEFLPRYNLLLTELDSTGFGLTISQIFGLTDTLSQHRTELNYLNGLAHSAVTLAGTPDYITIDVNQVITLNQIDLTTDVTGVLPDANVANDITLDNITQITNRSHTNLSDIGTNTHPQIDSHISNTNNPHNVTTTQLGIEVDTIVQNLHGFSIDDWISYKSGIVQRSLADTSVNADVIGVVKEVIDVNTFVYQYGGIYTGGTYTEGENYFLSLYTPGKAELDTQSYSHNNVYLFLGTGVENGFLIEIDVGFVIDTTVANGGTTTSVCIYNETPSGAINGINDTYSTASTFISNSTQVYLNGVRQILNTHYNETGGNIVFTGSYIPHTNDLLRVDYCTAVSANFIYNETPSGSINGVNDTFSTANSYTSNSTRIYLNGVRQVLGFHYNETGGNIVFTGSYIPQTNDLLRVDYEY